jgi:hypothetical protein
VAALSFGACNAPTSTQVEATLENASYESLVQDYARPDPNANTDLRVFIESATYTGTCDGRVVLVGELDLSPQPQRHSHSQYSN